MSHTDADITDEFYIENESRFNERVRADKLKLLFFHSIPASYTSPIVAFVLAAILWPVLDRFYLLGWIASIIFTSIARIFLFFLYKKKKPQGKRLLGWEKPYLYTLIPASMAWGWGSVAIMPPGDLLHQTIILYFLIGLSGSALSAYSAIRKFAFLAIFNVLAPATIWFLVQGEYKTLLIGSSGLIYLFSAIRATKPISQTLQRNFLMTYVLNEARENAEIMAKTDFLTGLNNRRSFYDLTEVELNYCARYNLPSSAIVLDIDNFKKINDSYGHAAGDQAIQHVATILDKNLRESDISGRFGGEEFAVFLPNTNLSGAMELSEKIRKLISESYVNISDNLKLTVSIGVAEGHNDIDLLLKNADHAMYQAKTSGKNRAIAYDRILNADAI